MLRSIRKAAASNLISSCECTSVDRRDFRLWMLMTCSETPIKILDCRVNPAWNSLPSYSTSHPGSSSNPASVCAIHNNPRHQIALAPPASTSTSGPASAVMNAVGIPSPVTTTASTQRPLPDSRISGLPPLDGNVQKRGSASAHGANEEDTLLERNIVFDRLMSGQETESGEVPPSYGEAVAHAVSRASVSGGGASGSGHTRGRGSASASRSHSRVRGEVVEVPSGTGSRSASRLGQAS